MSIPKETNSTSFILVKDSLHALQQLAAYHLNNLQLPVIAITGSNGKTIVKEYLYQLLNRDFFIVKSPKSYNSQLGVPLSVLRANEQHNLAIFEAGISTVNEMQPLEQILKPTIGIFTNLGSAHNEGFSSTKEKLNEKLTLFKDAETIIYNRKDEQVHQAIQHQYAEKQKLGWIIEDNQFKLDDVVIDLPTHQQQYFIENLGHCIAIFIHFNYTAKEITTRIKTIQPIAHRLQLIEGKQGLKLINDTYNNDLAGLLVALNFTTQNAEGKPISIILSDFEQSGLTNEQLAQEVFAILSNYSINKFIGIGSVFQQQSKLFKQLACDFYYLKSVDDFLQHKLVTTLAHQSILVKGARSYKLEQIIKAYKLKQHDAVWEINLSALVHNLNVYKSILKPGVKLMVMVKALAYGIHASQIAQLLQQQNVNYLGVAYPEEGKQLRDAAIHLPIMVMNTSEQTFETAVASGLEIQTFSIKHLTALILYLREKGRTNYPVHIKLDTGMHRLGFQQTDLPELIQLIQAKEIDVLGCLSHLANSVNITSALKQQGVFIEITNQLKSVLPKDKQLLLHLLNSSGIENKALNQFNLVRLGIGLYGISESESISQQLTQVGTLKARISQIKTVNKGEFVGYKQAFIAERKTKVGIISIGYADGYDRRFSNGKGKVLIHNQLAPIIGSVCMDMAMVDLTDITHVKEGDEVIITSPDLSIQQLAKEIEIIPYEFLTNVSPRISREFIYE